jgi:serine/threonine-protein kinase
MEFIPGVTLYKLIAKNGRFSPMRIRRILAQFCDVLQAAHDQGIIHRDLKPVNLMILDPDTPFEKLKVMDFGLAQMSDAEAQKNAPKEYAIGTPGYMPPEQVGGQPMDQRGDLYSVGVILYQLLSGRLPFPGETTMEILMAQAEGGPPTFESIGLADKVPPAVEYVIRACLEVDPGERPQSARELGDAYEQALAQSYGGGSSEPPPAAAAAPPPATAPAGPVAETGADPNTEVMHLEAFMPEQIAMYKLRGFVEEVGGTIVDSKPGLILVRLKVSMKGASGLFSLFGRRVSTVDLELHMKNKDPKQKNLLHITMVFRANDGGKLPETADWKARRNLIYSTLKAYLMSSSSH